MLTDDLFYFVLVHPDKPAEVRAIFSSTPANHFEFMKGEAGFHMAEHVRYSPDPRYGILCDEEALINPDPKPNRFGLYNSFVVVAEKNADFVSLGRKKAEEIAAQINGTTFTNDPSKPSPADELLAALNLGGEHWINIKKKRK